MKLSNVYCMFCVDVEAENEEEAVTKAKEKVNGMKWTLMWGPEIEAADIHEEVTP